MNEMDEARKQLRALYGENKRITDGHYDPSLAVKCINGIFVGRREENVISYKGIPFVGEQHAGSLEQDVCRGILLGVDFKLELRIAVLLALLLHHLLESLQVIGEVLHLVGCPAAN